MQAILAKFVVYKKFLYWGIKIPQKYVTYQPLKISEDKIEKFHINVFNRIKLDQQQLEDRPFLRERVRETYIILQSIIKKGNKYIIVTVEKHLMLQTFSIIMYLPHNGKRLLSTIYFSDLATLSPGYVSQILKITEDEFEHLFKSCGGNYGTFVDLYEKH